MAAVERLDFSATKVRVAELLGRPDLIIHTVGGTQSSERARTRARPSDGVEKVRRPRSKTRSKRASVHPGTGCSLSEYARAKRLPTEFLVSHGLRDVRYLRASAVSFPYFANDGSDPAIRFRIALDGHDRFRWRTGSKPRLYGLHRLADAHRAGYVVIVEGESDTLTLWYSDFPAVGLPGAGNWSEQRDAALFDGMTTIFIIREPDQGGAAVMNWLKRSAIAPRVRVVHLPGAKDPSALYTADPEGFKSAFQRALNEAEPWQDISDREAKAVAALARREVGDLIAEPNVLARFAADLARIPIVGEERNGKILYLALTSRNFQRPVSVAVKGPSSGGKSVLVERVLRFFPPGSYFERTALSDRALAFTDETFRHRVIVIYEASGMASEMGSYLIRSLLSEGRLKYEAVEKTGAGFRARLIEKEGPTSLIVTTTAPRLHPENETRLLSLTVKDTQDQTKAVLLALATDDDVDDGIDYGKWQAYQIFLETGERRVSVPFARRLADLIPPVAIRLRRDFGQVLSLLKAHTLLHRELRDRDERGRIVATLRDYAAVRELVADLIEEHVGAAVKKAVREAVEAVVSIGNTETSIAKIAKTLKLDRSAASRRVAEAIAGGYLKNEEPNKRKPARIVVGDPLPTGNTVILPYPDQLITHASTPDGSDHHANGQKPNGLDQACKRASPTGVSNGYPSASDGHVSEEFEERAAILEYEAGLLREEAERLAGLGTDEPT